MDKERLPEHIQRDMEEAKQEARMEEESGREKKVRSEAEKELSGLLRENRSKFSEEEFMGAEKLIKLRGNEAVDSFREEQESEPVRLEEAPEEFKELERSFEEILKATDNIEQIFSLVEGSSKESYKKLVKETYEKLFANINRGEIKKLLKQITSVLKDKKTTHPDLIESYGKNVLVKDLEKFKDDFSRIVDNVVFSLDNILIGCQKTYKLQHRLSPKELDKENLDEIQKKLREQENVIRMSLEEIDISPSNLELLKAFDPYASDIELHYDRKDPKEVYPHHPEDLKFHSIVEITQWPYRYSDNAKKFRRHANPGGKIRSGMVYISP